jgi:hypothetical protein
VFAWAVARSALAIPSAPYRARPTLPSWATFQYRTTMTETGARWTAWICWIVSTTFAVRLLSERV